MKIYESINILYKYITINVYKMKIYKYTYLHEAIYHKALTHTITEAKKSHDLPSPAWRPSRAGGIIRSKFKDLENQGLGANGVVSSSGPKA